MDSLSKLIFGLKKEVRVQQKLVIIFVVGTVILAIVAGLILFKPWQRKTSVPAQKPAQQIPKPTQTIPKTNPFEVKTNPFKETKTNPFR